VQHHTNSERSLKSNSGNFVSDTQAQERLPSTAGTAKAFPSH
jgi:hypothetical protein